LLRNAGEVDEAVLEIARRRWPLHKWNRYKNWDSTFLDFEGVSTILDVGCRTSHPLEIASFLKVQGRKVGVDIEATYDGWEIPDGCEFVLAPAEALPFHDATFDMVTCISVIEHGVDIPRFVKEMHRVLNPGGRFVITFDFWPGVEGALDFLDVSEMVEVIHELGCVVEPLDWSLKDRVIDDLFTVGAIRGVKRILRLTPD